MNMSEWMAFVTAAAAAFCGVRYIVLRSRKKDSRCKGCPYAEKCSRECDKNGKQT